jgi:SecD/SecF fusion protein
MIDNIGRYYIAIGVALLISLLALFVPARTFELGLDLQGGTRYVLVFDFEEERRLGNIGPDESEQDVIQQAIDIIGTRADPDGVREPIIRQEGVDRVVIELPGRITTQASIAPSALQVAIDAGSTDRLVIDPATADPFPASGGKIEVAGEKLRYETRGGAEGNELIGLRRGEEGTVPAAHEVGAPVRLVSSDSILNAIQSLGDLAFVIVLTDNTYLAGSGTDLIEQRQRLDTWLAANPDGDLRTFNSLSPEDGGPHERLRWVPAKRTGPQDPRTLSERAQPLLRLENHPDYADRDWNFDGPKLRRAYAQQDPDPFGSGFVVGFEFKDVYASAFGAFTENFRDRPMAIVLNGQVETVANIDEPIYGSGVIRGDYTFDEVEALVTVLRSGSLRLQPRLEAEERVGPTLGAAYVKRGALSGAVTLVAVLGFMAWYYKRLGLLAVVTLLTNLFLFAGGLALLRPTITLPGIAGIILTIGMAVDANILIFDRFREERDNGRNIKQAAKGGFDKAFSAIVDANITTLLTAMILKFVATGPVRGFANTLSIGVITSVFSALVVTRVLLHRSLEKRPDQDLEVGTWMVNAAYQWMSHRKLALTVSGAAMAASLLLFALAPRDVKYGIDFLGGATVQFRTDEAQTPETVRERIGQLEGYLSEAEVKPVVASADGDGFREFRATFKVDPGEQNAEAELDFQSELRQGLADLLQRGPIELAIGGQDPDRVEGRLYFGEPHPVPDVLQKLESVGLAETQALAVGGAGSVFEISGRLTPAVDRVGLAGDLEQAFLSTPDSDNLRYTLPGSITDSSLVGAQVVGDLKDKAILAILLSLWVTVMYIRVRFADYSYGFAAVACLVHDVIIALGACVLVNWLGWINAELSLTMIAAFLTIIGYSINDTIIIFDRVRENLPRMEAPLSKVLDTSINQTLSRTILTSGTTLIAVGIIFLFNVGTGNALEGFSFAMLLGVGVGTYSTIYIASPLLLWFERMREIRAAKQSALERGRSVAKATP